VQQSSPLLKDQRLFLQKESANPFCLFRARDFLSLFISDFFFPYRLRRPSFGQRTFSFLSRPAKEGRSPLFLFTLCLASPFCRKIKAFCGSLPFPPTISIDTPPPKLLEERPPFPFFTERGSPRVSTSGIFPLAFVAAPRLKTFSLSPAPRWSRSLFPRTNRSRFLPLAYDDEVFFFSPCRLSLFSLCLEQILSSSTDSRRVGNFFPYERRFFLVSFIFSADLPLCIPSFVWWQLLSRRKDASFSLPLRAGTVFLFPPSR